jgi:hypothetical protein
MSVALFSVGGRSWASGRRAGYVNYEAFLVS